MFNTFQLPPALVTYMKMAEKFEALDRALAPIRFVESKMAPFLRMEEEQVEAIVPHRCPFCS